MTSRPSTTPRRRRWRWIAGAYALLLLVSFVVRSAGTRGAGGDTAASTAALRAVSNGTTGDDVVTLAFSDLGTSDEATGSAVLLVHGSPGTRAELLPLADRLAGRHRVIVPDLPGFGASTRDVPDYSIRAHAAYLVQLMDALGLEQAHVVGYSMGGGVALMMAEAVPARVRSICLLASIGAQEFELLGDYRLNHAVHAAQLAALWALREGTPHLGWLDDAMLGVPYARNFYDSDQRPLRAVLRTLAMPTLILHGTRDPLVPVEAALEHARLVPQSTLETFDDGHFMPFTRTEPLARSMNRFFDAVEAGHAATRAVASDARVRAAAEGVPVPVPPAHGLAGIVLASLLGVATFASEDLASIGAGLLVSHGRLTFPLALSGCFAGIVVGDVLLFLAGRWCGQSPLGQAVLRRLVRPAALERSARWLEARGASVILSSRFLPGTRLPTYLAAGILGMNPWTFLLYFTVAAAVWTPLVVGFGALPYASLVAGLPLGGIGPLGIVVLLVGLALVLRLVCSALVYERRRAFVSVWRRWTRWEFWPMWLFYPPIVIYLVWLGLRHRGLTVFTATNPGMLWGGFVGESKADILARVDAVTDRVPPFVLIKGDERADAKRALALAMVEAHGWPLVLKPDQGQRGAGVAIVRSQSELDQALHAMRIDTIAQAYVPGVEFGVFYYRRPTETCGHVFAITEKRLVVVTGDGRRTLEQLILDDARAVAMAQLYLAINDARRQTIPSAGERVQLSELGVHSRGCIFLDGAHARTPALEAAIDRIGRAVDGFHFGRFDVRADSLAAFKSGEFSVIELNGVTSEATNIYDPAYSVIDAYRILSRQWRIAFEIGAENRARGVRPARLRDLAVSVTNYNRVARSHYR